MTRARRYRHLRVLSDDTAAFITSCNASAAAPGWGGLSRDARGICGGISGEISATTCSIRLSCGVPAMIIHGSGSLTMPVKIHPAVLDGELGLAAALSTVPPMCTGARVHAVFRFAENRDSVFL